MFSSMKLRTKMILGFLLAFSVNAFAIYIGTTGLRGNIQQNDYQINLNSDVNMVREMEMSLATSEKAFYKYLTTADQKDYLAFIVAFDEMRQKTVNLDLSMLTVDDTDSIKQDIKAIQSELDTYYENFMSLYKARRNKTAALEEVAMKSLMISEELTGIQQQSDVMNDQRLRRAATDAMAKLLAYRLSASRYFSQPSGELYGDFLALQEDLRLAIMDLSALDENAIFQGELERIQSEIDLAAETMSSLNGLENEIIALTEALNASGPLVNQKAGKIVDEIVAKQQASMVSAGEESLSAATELGAATMISALLFALIFIVIMRAVLRPIRTLQQTFELMADGDTDTSFRLPVKGRDEVGQMSEAFNRFMLKLSEIMDDVRYQNWLKTIVNDLSEMTIDGNKVDVFGNTVLSYLTEQIKSLQGRLYIYSRDQQQFQLVSGAGIDEVDGIQAFAMGEGLMGQQAKTGSVAHLTDLPDDYMKIRTGLGEASIKHLLVLPCRFEDETVGVIELARMKAFNERDVALLEHLSDVIGSMIHAITLRAEVHELLDRTMTQSEQLQQQQEELKQTNEELMEQTRVLKESEQRLQLQQEELRVSNEELEERSKQLEIQRTELDNKNKAIIASQDEIIEKAYALEEANRYKSEFLANMSHELRTPLNSILVLSQLLETRQNNRPLSEKELSFAGTIHSSGSDLLQLINGVLDLSKVEAGHLELIKEDVPMTSLVKESEGLFAQVAKEKGIDFRTRIEKDVPENIYTDRLRLSQIIKNLISNALKFTHEGYVELHVRRPSPHECEYTGTDSSNYIAFEVRDTGIGIEPDKKDVIFEAFRQQDGTTSRTYGGTGLGLTISLELARLLGGDIILESEVGVGSQFVMITPLSDGYTASAVQRKRSRNIAEVALDEAVEAADAKEEEETLARKASVASGYKEESMSSELLIIEDDSTFSRVLADMATEKGYKAIVAHTGEEGLRLAREIKPVAIILDMGLPDMDGTTVARRLESNTATEDIPIHIISGREDLDTTGLPGSIVGMLKKPVDVKSIYKTLSVIESAGKDQLKKLLVVGDCGGESFEMFQSLGKVMITKVLTGKAGLAEFGHRPVGCVVVDANLKDMEASSFVSQLKELKNGQVPIIIFTEGDVDLDAFKAMGSGVDRVVVKSEKSNERLVDEVSLFLHDMTNAIRKYDGATFRTVKANVKQMVAKEEQLSGRRILLVDDDERNVFALTSALEQYGLEVLSAWDGKAALDLLEREDGIEWILMDIMMPKMDGYEAISRIRNLSGPKKDLPIIALTAKAMAEDREKCIKAGANDYLTKPIDMEKLMTLMKVWMKQ